MRSTLCAAISILVGTAALAQSPQEQMFPRSDSCYARIYGAAHLRKHPEQRINRFSITPDFVSVAPRMALELRLGVRDEAGGRGGALEAYAICENTGGSIYCTMEGDAGGFQIDPAKNRAIQITVSSLGMTFETNDGFITLKRDSGDDRSFILRPSTCK
jgi:hypothetical protein